MEDIQRTYSRVAVELRQISSDLFFVEADIRQFMQEWKNAVRAGQEIDAETLVKPSVTKDRETLWGLLEKKAELSSRKADLEMELARLVS